jgi:polyketide biosynthesis acyl carrier protein
MVNEQIRMYLPHLAPEDILGHAHLKELGADSVERIEIIGGLVKRLDLRVPLARFAEIKSIDALVDFLVETSARG